MARKQREEARKREPDMDPRKAAELAKQDLFGSMYIPPSTPPLSPNQELEPLMSSDNEHAWA